MPTPPITQGRNFRVPAENRPSIEVDTKRRLKAYWGLCVWPGPTITAPRAKVDSARGTARFGLDLFSLTPGVLRMTGSTAALVSFEESAALLRELAGVEVSISQVQRAAEALGAEIATDERVCVEKMSEVAPTMYLGMDGTGVPMRPAEVAGRAGKQPDGSA